MDAFPSIFRNSGNCVKLRNVHRKKAQSWWNGRHVFLSKIANENDCRLYVSTVNVKGVCRKRFPVKAMSGRGRKRKEWTRFVHTFLDEEFERLSHIGVKITSSLLLAIAQHSLTTEGSPVSPHSIDESNGKTYNSLIDHHFITRYLEVSKTQEMRKRI